MYKRPIFVFVLLAAFVCCVWQDVEASQREEAFLALQRAREALALGDMSRWKKELLALDEALVKGLVKSDEQRELLQLWSWMMWSRYYQYQGILPPVRGVESFESVKQLEIYIVTYNKALRSQEKARSFLRKYIALFTRISQTSKLEMQIQLQAALSLERDLETTITLGKVYLVFLRFAKKNISDKASIENQAKALESSLQALQKKQEESSLTQREIRKEQKNLSLSMNKTLLAYQRFEADFQARIASSRGLVIAGAVLLGVGAVTLGMGGIFLWDQGNLRKPLGESSSVFFGKPSTTSEAQEAAQNLNVFTISFFVVGGSSLSVGAILLILGIVRKPKEQEKKGLPVKAHGLFLQDIRPEDENKKTSFFLRQRSSMRCVKILEVQ